MSTTPDASHYAGQDLEALSDLPRYNAWILQHFSEHLRGRTLEVGAGIGNVAAHYLPQVDHALLVEPAVNLFTQLQMRFSGDNRVTTACALLKDVDPSLLAQPFDAAIMVNVLEHIEDDAAVLRDLFGRVKPGGALLLFVPALPFLYGSLDELVHHVRRYTMKSLEQVVSDAGFAVHKLRYMDALGMAPWLVVGRVLKQRKFSQTGAQLYDRVGVPVTKWLEERVKPPLGKSLVCVAIKPENA